MQLNRAPALRRTLKTLMGAAAVAALAGVASPGSASIIYDVNQTIPA